MKVTGGTTMAQTPSETRLPIPSPMCKRL
jgi:hypothetical protein